MMALGVDGMSSDESDHPSGQGEPIYKIANKDWRPLELKRWLRTSDSLHLWGRYRGMFSKTPGNWPHFRSPSINLNSSRPPVPGLPSNCYSDSWKMRTTEFYKDQLQIIDRNVNLTFPKHLLE